MPLISVIIPTYNRADRLKRAIESVLNQTEDDLELIIVDDGSTDRTAETVKALDDPRIRYAYQENAGACAARNRGVSLARGAYIAFQDSDDCWRPNKLRRQLHWMEETGADVVYGRLGRVCPDGTVALYPAETPPGFLGPADAAFGIGTQTLFVRRAVFSSQLFDPDMPRFQEMEWLCRVRKQFTVYGMAETVADYAPGEDSISTNTDALLRACGLLMQKHPDLLPHSPETRRVLRDCLLSEAERAFRRRDNRYSACLAWAAQIDGGVQTALLSRLGRGGYAWYLSLRNWKVKRQKKPFPLIRGLKAVRRTLLSVRDAEAVRFFPQKCRVFGTPTALALMISQTADLLFSWHTHFFHRVIRRFCDDLFTPIAAQLSPQSAPTPALQGPLPVWTLWWDGEENAPPCVRLCLKSHRRFFPAPDFDYHMLTKESYAQYVSLEPLFLQRFERGDMSLTHLSDVLRCELLSRYGGLWIDATVLLSGPLEREVLGKPWYTNRKTTYPENLRRLIPAGRWACYLMGCWAGNPLMEFLTAGYRLYWQRYSAVIDYYLLDDMIDAACRLLPGVREMTEAVRPDYQRIFDLYRMRNEAYSPEKMTALFRDARAHKLSYKEEYRRVTAEGKMTVWAYLLEEAERDI